MNCAVSTSSTANAWRSGFWAITSIVRCVIARISCRSIRHIMILCGWYDWWIDEMQLMTITLNVTPR